MYLPDKVKAIKNIAEPTTKRLSRSFTKLINYYSMWQQGSKILTPLSNMTSKQVKWNLSKECQKAFDSIKKLVLRETLLSDPTFNEPFEVHMDASKLHLRSVISQKVNPLYCIVESSILHRSMIPPQNVNNFLQWKH